MIALLSILVLAVSFYVQYAVGLAPCPLCLMQRFMMFALLFVALRGLLGFTKRRACVLGCFQLLFSSGGLFFAARQLWLQSLPSTETGMCLPGIESLMHKLPWQDIVHVFIWGGSSSCGEVDWAFVGFSMPAWSAVYFGLMVLMSLFVLVRLLKHGRIPH